MVLEVIKFRDTIPVLSVPGYVPGTVKPTVELKGEDFRSVERVLINDVVAPAFIIVDQHTIWVELPVSSNERVGKIEVISSDFTVTNTASKMEFEIGNKTRNITGILKLVQYFTKWLLQSPGTDIFNPERGGGLQDLAGKLVSTKNMQPVYSSVTRAVSQTSSQIRTVQANVRNLPLDEKLQSATAVDFQIYDALMEARVRVAVRSVAGREAVSAILL
jgi:hypothetical protein